MIWTGHMPRVSASGLASGIIMAEAISGARLIITLTYPA
jgi:hypothetical protein